MFNGYFERLTEGTDYYFDNKLGYIRLNRSIMDNEILAVSYRRANGEAFGNLRDFPGGIDAAGARRILKMIKLTFMHHTQVVKHLSPGVSIQSFGILKI